jgi:hypothetical protein
MPAGEARERGPRQRPTTEAHERDTFMGCTFMRCTPMRHTPMIARDARDARKGLLFTPE